MNRLTEKLFAEGYTKDNPPENMYWDHDGFRYHYWFMAEKTFQAPCKLLCKGSTCHTGLYFMGIDWSFEDDMATIHCPYDKTDCILKHEYLKGHGVLKFWCNVRRTDKEYKHEGSVEAAAKLHDGEIRRKLIAEKAKRKGKVCETQSRFDREKQEWTFWYDPAECARGFCKAANDLGQSPCPILGRTLDKKKGNVFYDLKITQTDRSKDGTFFEGDTITTIEKGKRVFKKNVSMDICKNYVKLNKGDLIRSVKLNKYHKELFFAEYFGRVFEIEILNIRAEQRMSRDLDQDLRDIADGIEVSYEADLIKEKAELKKNARQDRKNKRRERIKKKILLQGWDSLGCSDHRFIEKYVNPIEVKEWIREQKRQAEMPEQLSIFDFLQQTKEGGQQ